MSTSTAAPIGMGTKMTMLAGADDFCNRVLRACADPAAKSAIRSALGKRPEQANRAHLTMARLVPVGVGIGSEREEIYYTIAALAATFHPFPAWFPPRPRRDVGAVLADLADRNILSTNSAAMRVQLLARGPVVNLLTAYRNTAHLARTARIGCDYGIWLRDALLWATHREQTTMRIAYSYARYNPVFSDPDDTSGATAATA